MPKHPSNGSPDGRSRVLITGASGLLGENLLRLLARDHALAACSFKNRVVLPADAAWTGDLSVDQKSFVEFVTRWKPDAIVHCAAETRVDWCEQNPGQAYVSNVESMQVVCRAAEASGAWLLAISTDSVFDGQKGNYGELDPVRPVNVYARTKLCAESLATSRGGQVCSLRTNFYGFQASAPNKGFAAWLLGRFESGQEITGFEDVIFSPLFVSDLGEIVASLIRLRPTGILHAASRNAVSKADFAIQLGESRGLPTSLVRRCSLSSVPLAAPRPLNTTLNCDRLSQLLGRPLPSVADGLFRFNESLASAPGALS